MSEHNDEHDPDYDDDDDDDDDGGDEGTETEAPAEVEAPPVTRPARPRARPAAAQMGPPSPFGAMPHDCSAWGVRRKTEVGGWTGDLEWAAPGATIAVREWPLAELSEQAIRERFGPGTYQVHWFGTNARGGRAHIAYGREITILPAMSPPAAASSPAGPAAALGGSAAQLADALQLIGILESQAAARRAAVSAEASETINGMAQLAAAMQGTRGGGGIDAEALRAILAEQRQATIDAVRAAIGADDDDDDGDDVAETAGQVARAAAPLVRAKGTLGTVLAFAQAQPELAGKVVQAAIPGVIQIVQSIASALAPPPPARAVASALPRAVRVEPSPAPPPAPPVENDAEAPPAVISGLSAAAAPSS